MCALLHGGDDHGPFFERDFHARSGSANRPINNVRGVTGQGGLKFKTWNEDLARNGRPDKAAAMIDALSIDATPEPGQTSTRMWGLK